MINNKYELQGMIDFMVAKYGGIVMSLDGALYRVFDEFGCIEPSEAAAIAFGMLVGCRSEQVDAIFDGMEAARRHKPRTRRSRSRNRRRRSQVSRRARRSDN